MLRNLRRIEALENAGGHGCQPQCWVIAEESEHVEQAITRHKADEGCIENSGGHIVWCVVGSRAQLEPVA
jgi:hypothetical protein